MLLHTRTMQSNSTMYPSLIESDNLSFLLFLLFIETYQEQELNLKGKISFPNILSASTFMHIPQVALPQVPSRSIDDPTQDKPPLAGAGLEQFRYRYRRPPTHVEEHADQPPHGAQLPSVGQTAVPLHSIVSIELPAHSCPLE